MFVAGWMAPLCVVTVLCCPAISIPAARLTSTGLPIGLQIIGRQGFDAQVIAAAALLESLQPALPTPDLIPRAAPDCCSGPSTEDEARVHHRLNRDLDPTEDQFQEYAKEWVRFQRTPTVSSKL